MANSVDSMRFSVFCKDNCGDGCCRCHH